MRRLFIIILSAAAIFGLCVCQSGGDIITKTKFQYKADPITFKKEPQDAPVMTAGYKGTPLIVIDPSVIKGSEGYHLFFSTFCVPTPDGLSVLCEEDNPSVINIKESVTAIGYAFSPDKGLTWTLRETPVLTPGDDEWDNFRVETANAIVHDGTLHLFYCADGSLNGKRMTTRYQIGAVSLKLDGMTIKENLLDQNKSFSRDRSQPVLPFVTNEISFLNNVQEPSVIYKDGHFELYFIGLELALPGEPIDEKTPDQRLNKIGLGRAILNDKLEVQDVTQQPLIEGVNIIEIRVYRDKYYMFSVMQGEEMEGSAHQGEKIDCFTSFNGVTWKEAFPVITPDPDCDFDNWAVISPTAVVEEETGEIVFFYTGMGATPGDGNRWGIPVSRGRIVNGTLVRAVAYLQ